MLNLLYTPSRGGFTQTWDLCEGLLEACKQEGVLGFAFNRDKDDFTKDPNLLRYPVLVPANHFQPYFNVPENLRNHKWIRIETESITNINGIESSYKPWMEQCSKDYSEIYTFDFGDSFNYFGRRVRFQYPFVSDELFRPIEVSEVKQSILMFGSPTDSRKKLAADCGNIIEYRQSQHFPEPRENAESLNKMLNEHKFVLCQTSTAARMLTGKIFYGLAARKLVFVEDSEWVQHAKWTFVPNKHCVYFKDYKDLTEKYKYFQGHPEEYMAIVLAGYALFKRKFTTREFVRRVNEECGSQ